MARGKQVVRYHPLMAQSKAQLGHCATCERQILTARYDALTRHWDPQPLSQLGELEALFCGVKTWWLFGSTTYRRHADAITTSPKGTGGIIVRDHDCDRPQPQGASVNFNYSTYDGDDPGF